MDHYAQRASLLEVEGVGEPGLVRTSSESKLNKIEVNKNRSPGNHILETTPS